MVYGISTMLMNVILRYEINLRPYSTRKTVLERQSIQLSYPASSSLSYIFQVNSRKKTHPRICMSIPNALVTHYLANKPSSAKTFQASTQTPVFSQTASEQRNPPNHLPRLYCCNHDHQYPEPSMKALPPRAHQIP